MKDQNPLVSYCYNINNTDKMTRKEVLDMISEMLEQIREHSGLEALNYDNKNVFLIRNCEFDN